MQQWLSRLEHIMEDTLEGTFRHLFRASLQPVELAKALERAMEGGLMVGPETATAPNHYVVRLHPSDHRRIASYRETLQRELADHLAERARRRGWRLHGAVQVEVLAHSSVPIGRCEVDARLEDRPPQSLPTPIAIEHTARLDLVAAVERSSGIKGVLRASGGHAYPLDGPVITLGRALENDVVLPDPRISRYHAQIRRRDGRFVILDLGSTNGTFVRNEQVVERVLSPGDEVSLGGFTMVFDMGDA